MTPLAELLNDLVTGPAGPVHQSTGAPLSQAERDLLAWATPSELRFAQHELEGHAAAVNSNRLGWHG